MSSHCLFDDASSYLYLGNDVHDLAWVMVTDGMDSNSAGNHSKTKSIIPILMICLNLPPWIRTLDGNDITMIIDHPHD